jgi:hypothetical protein
MSNTDTGKQGGAPALSQNNLASLSSAAKKNAPSISGSSGGNATGPAIANDTSKRNG